MPDAPGTRQRDRSERRLPRRPPSVKSIVTSPVMLSTVQWHLNRAGCGPRERLRFFDVLSSSSVASTNQQDRTISPLGIVTRCRSHAWHLQVRKSEQTNDLVGL